MIEYYILEFTGTFVAIGIIGGLILVLGKGKNASDAFEDLQDKIDDPDIEYKSLGAPIKKKEK